MDAEIGAVRVIWRAYVDLVYRLNQLCVENGTDALVCNERLVAMRREANELERLEGDGFTHLTPIKKIS